MTSQEKYYQKNKKQVIARSKTRNKKYPEEHLLLSNKWHRQNRGQVKSIHRGLRENRTPEETAALSLRSACKRVGITVEHYNSLPKICSNPGCATTNPGLRSWHKDHDHTTGKFRGLLCHGCNVALGFLKDDKNRIAGLLLYLERHPM